MTRVGKVGGIASCGSKHVIGDNALYGRFRNIIIIQVSNGQSIGRRIRHVVALHVHVTHVVSINTVAERISVVLNGVIVHGQTIEVVEVGTVVVGLEDLVVGNFKTRTVVSNGIAIEANSIVSTLNHIIGNGDVARIDSVAKR